MSGAGKAMARAATISPTMSDPATPSPAPGPGCLTDGQIAEVRAAAGTLAESLARHLTGCERCQERVLFGPQGRARKHGRPRPEFPTLRRALLLFALALAAIAAFFYTLQKLAGRP
jgi:hypothetical protein